MLVITYITRSDQRSQTSAENPESMQESGSPPKSNIISFLGHVKPLEKFNQNRVVY